MACVVKRRNRWTLDYRDQRGIRRKEAIKGTRKDAEALLAQRLQEIGRGDYESSREQKTFAELVEEYTINHIQVNVRLSTQMDYKTNLRLHIKPFFAETRLRTITPEMIERWRAKMRERGIGVRTINKCHMLIGAMLEYARKHRWVSDNVASLVKKMREERPTSDDQPEDNNMLRPKEVRRLLDNADARWHPILLTAVSTGLRQGELLGLQWGDIDWETKQVHVRRQFSKGRFSELKTRHSRRRVGLSGDVLLELKRWKLSCPKGEHDLVFPSDDGRPLNHGILLRSGFYPALRRAKMRHVRFHDLRHTFASLLIAQNVHPKRIQALMGHSTIRITFDTYGHLMQEHDDGAAEKLATLITGPKTVPNLTEGSEDQSQVIEKMEAGVGIEPAYTALQAAA